MGSESMHEKMMRLHGSGAEEGMKPGHSGAAMKKASFEVALKDKKQIAEGTTAFVFEKPKGLKFKAGQHIRMTLIDPTETDDEGDSRFLSLASTPQDKDLVIAMRMRDTAFKRNLGNMQIGDKVLIQILLRVPHGAFALHDDASKPAVYIVGGIGIIPAYSMIKDALQRKLSHKIYLFYSNRRPEDAPFLDELQDLSKQNDNFKLIATMTEAEKSAEDWKGETGFINQAMLVEYIDDLKLPIYYVSGLPAMVSSMRAILTDAGVGKDTIKAEEFTGFNLNEIANNTGKTQKRPMVFVAAALTVAAIVAFGFAHVAGAGSVFGSLTFTNPLTYLMIGLLVIAVAFKVRLLRALSSKKPHKSKEVKGE
jgi:ferredoxin-NADP reductase